MDMRHNLLDVLMYLIENDLTQSGEGEVSTDPALVEREMRRVGFATGDVRRVLDWLEEFVLVRAEAAAAGDDAEEDEDPGSAGLRVYTAEEQVLLDTECRGLLLACEQRGVLSPVHRERVIERIAALGAQPNAEQLRWVIGLVLCAGLPAGRIGVCLEQVRDCGDRVTLH